MIETGKRLLSLILCGLMLFGSVSCSDTSKDSDTEKAAGESVSGSVEETIEETGYPDDIPEETTFSSDSIRFIVTRDKDILYIDEEESDLGEALNEAVWKRNNLLEDRLEVTIEEPIDTDSGDIMNMVSNSVAAGSDDYDLVVGHARFNAPLVLRNSMRRLDDLEYLDLGKPYWSEGFNENAAYDGNHFWVVGDISKYYIACTYLILTNALLWNNHYPNEDIYDIVRDGKWTIDKLREYTSSAYEDTNGNGLKDEEDTLGFAAAASHIYNGLFFAANVQYTTRDSEGVPQIAINSEHSLKVFELLRDFLYNGDGVFRMTNQEEDSQLNIKMFTADKLLFKPGQFSDLENDLIRNMDTDFYVIPMPKYDEAQGNYRSSQHDGTAIYGITTSVPEDRIDAVSATLEAMCSMASTMIRPVYYDDILKSKYSRDPETAEMVDLIRASLETDFGHVWSDAISSTSIFTFFISKINNESISSFLEKSSNVWERGLDKLISNLDDLADQYN